MELDGSHLFTVLCTVLNNTLKYANPIINLNSSTLLNNIKELNNELPSSLKGNVDVGDYLNIDIKMETGTGKTYVYTKTIFELNKNYEIYLSKIYGNSRFNVQIIGTTNIDAVSKNKEDFNIFNYF